MWFVKLIPSRMLSLQARKPSGLVGRFVMSKIFNTANADLNTFVKEGLTLRYNDQVLEIGFGPGKLTKEMADITIEGHIEGIDFSDAMLKVATQTNAEHIASGRVSLHQGECSQLPFENNRFDKVCAVNTVYFWEKPKDYFAEMFRVLRPGGKIVIGFRDDQQMRHLALSQDVFNTVSKKDMTNLLSGAGFINAQINEKDGKPFVSYCGVATKPSPSC